MTKNKKIKKKNKKTKKNKKNEITQEVCNLIFKKYNFSTKISYGLKISVWNSQWKIKKHQLSDWLSLSGDGKITARFNRREADQVLYWTNLKFYIYSLSKQHVLKVSIFKT